ncbi:hypothetical protein HAX54_002016 [Datura stramonium]|uniref:Uncharacterized protein n=1 Tax=Datura stramonium TaxID=4076 RepID=A0ABS8WVV5_DATST|nr:hypothetical protein [Datura stramonium]
MQYNPPWWLVAAIEGRRMHKIPKLEIKEKSPRRNDHEDEIHNDGQLAVVEQERTRYLSNSTRCTKDGEPQSFLLSPEGRSHRDAMINAVDSTFMVSTLQWNNDS